MLISWRVKVLKNEILLKADFFSLSINLLIIFKIYLFV